MDDVIEKIKKCLAMAQDMRGNEHERDNALRQAYKLMAKYNLEMHEVEAHGQVKQENRINFENVSWSWTWSCQVHMIVGELFFCKYYFGRKINGTKVTHHFIGKESNATTAAMMADWITTSILSEGRKIYKQNTAPGTRSFAVGAMHRLDERVKEIIRTTQAEATPGTALVLASLYQTEAEANKQLLPSTLRERAARHSKIDHSAYRKGQTFANGINLGLQVTEEARKLA